MRIHPVPARHGIHITDAYTFGQELSDGDYRYLGYVVELDGVRVYHAGDTIAYEGMVERLRELQVDVALLPINGRDHFREREDVVGNLTPGRQRTWQQRSASTSSIPMHYDVGARQHGITGHLHRLSAAYLSPGLDATSRASPPASSTCPAGHRLTRHRRERYGWL